MAVDNSGGAGGAGEGEQGRIYAANENGPINAWKANGEPLGGNFPLAYPSACALEVAPNGNLWAAQWTGGLLVKEFTPDGVETGNEFNAGVGVCGMAID